MRHRVVMGMAVFLAVCGLRCNVNAQTDQQTSPAASQAMTQDEAGRPVQTGGTTTATPIPAATPDQRQNFAANVKDVYFDFNKADLRADDQAILQKNAEWLKANPNLAFTIEGDADERGNIVYNVFLSDQRALETRDALVKLGIPESRTLYATGWGKLYPACTDSNESCWSQNRRSHFAPWPPEDLSKRAQAASAAGADLGGVEAAWQPFRQPDLLARSH
jgi:peptidoglycan-associated lipoprotein